MFAALTNTENDVLYAKLERAGHALHGIPRETLSAPGAFVSVASAELELIDLRSDLTAALNARTDAILAALNSGITPAGTRYCRTCGFVDCPGATSGACPRWPAG